MDIGIKKILDCALSIKTEDQLDVVKNMIDIYIDGIKNREMKYSTYNLLKDIVEHLYYKRMGNIENIVGKLCKYPISFEIRNYADVDDDLINRLSINAIEQVSALSGKDLSLCYNPVLIKVYNGTDNIVSVEITLRHIKNDNVVPDNILGWAFLNKLEDVSIKEDIYYIVYEFNKKRGDTLDIKVIKRETV